MKKLLAGAVALALASCAAGSPAYAADNNRPRYEQQHKKQDERREHRSDERRYDHHRNTPNVTFGVILGNQGYPTYGHYERNDRRWRDSSFLYWRYFRNAPSYYPGRCNPHYTVILRDPYTNRLVCLTRENYSRYRYEMRYNRY